MGNKTGSLELINNDVTLYSVTYPVATEVPVEIPYTNQVVDMGTVALGAGNEESAEFAVYFKDANATATNGKVWISNHFPGLKFVVDATDATLSAALTAAGTPASYSTTAGIYTDAITVATTTGESNRIKFQLQGNQTNFGSLPYDPTKDNIKYGANMYLWWNSSDYVKRLDALQGRKASDGLVEINNVEFFIHETIEGVENMISLGDIRDQISLDRAAEIVELTKGFPTRRVKNTQVSTNYTYSMNLEVRDPKTTEYFMRHDLSYDSTNKHWKQVKNDKVDLSKKRFTMICYTVDNTVIVTELPLCEIISMGTMEFGGENYTLPIEIRVLPSDDNDYGISYISPNETFITLINLKFAITV
jgi:hypothetical protein